MALQLNRKESIFDYVGDFAKGVGDVFTTGAQFVGSLPGAATDFAKGVGGVFQGAARVPETTVRTVAQPLVDVLSPGASASQQEKNTGIRAFLYGEDPLQTYYDQAKSVGTTLSDLTGNSEFAKYGIFAAPFLAGLDIGTGGKGRTVRKGAEQLAETSLKNANLQPTQLPKTTLETVSESKPAVKLKSETNSVAPNPPPGINLNDPFGNKNLLTRIRNEAGSLVDDDAQMIKLLRQVENGTGRKGLVDQWMFDTGNVRASNSIANTKLLNSSELKQALGGLGKGELDEFDVYTGARAELKNYDGLKTSRAADENSRIVQALDAKYGERFSALNRYYKGLARDAHSAGLIDDARLENYLSSDDYVRIQRDMDDLVNQGFGRSERRSIGTTTLTQKRTGSEREILSPTHSVAKRTQELELEVQRNIAATNTINVLQELGLARQVSDTKNKNTVSRFVKGKREVYQVPGDVKKVMDNVSPYQLGVIARIVSFPARVFRAGTTALSAPFTVTNYFRDQASSAIYSKAVAATHNPQNIVSSLASAARDFAGESASPLWKKFEEFTGNQTIYDELRNAANTKDLLRQIRLGQGGKVANMVKHPIRTLEDLNSITERATRFQNFKGIYKKTLKATGNEEEAIKAAVLAARQNSVDFQRNSNFTRAMNLFIPYFNASVQGSRNVARSFRDRPVQTSLKSIGLVAIPAVTVTVYNYSDPERRKVYESIDDFEKENNFIVVGPNATQNQDGTWEGVVKIPKPQGYRELTDPARDVTEAFVSGEEPQSVAEMFKDMLGGLTGPVNIQDGQKLVGSFIPQAAKPWIQLGMNMDLYTGSDIVPDYMLEETDDPTKRAYDGTSGTARLIAEQLGVSPIQVEKVITDITGSLGRYGINAADSTLAAAGAIPQDQVGGRSIADDFSRRLFEAKGELRDENKSSGRKYFDDVQTVSKGLNKNELAAFNSVHPQKTNFLGEDIFDDNKRITAYTRAGAYLNNPAVLEADRNLDRLQRGRGKPGNPLFDLPNPLLTKVLLKAALPPGATDPELSNLYKEPWYQDYQNARSKYYDAVKKELTKEGKELPKSLNPYPQTSPDMQRVMDTYSALPKGTGERSAWIQANPGLWQQMTAQWAAVDAWENKERVAIGLAPVQPADQNASRSTKPTDPTANPLRFAVSLNAGGQVARPRIAAKRGGAAKGYKQKAVSRPKVTLKRSTV